MSNILHKIAANIANVDNTAMMEQEAGMFDKFNLLVLCGFMAVIGNGLRDSINRNTELKAKAAMGIEKKLSQLGPNVSKAIINGYETLDLDSPGWMGDYNEANHKINENLDGIAAKEGLSRDEVNKMRDRLIGEWEKDHEKKYFAVDLARHGVTPEDVTISADGLVVEIDGEKKTIKLR